MQDMPPDMQTGTRTLPSEMPEEEPLGTHDAMIQNSRPRPKAHHCSVVTETRYSAETAYSVGSRNASHASQSDRVVLQATS